MEFIKLVEKITKKKIIKRYLKKQKGDVVKTYGQNNKLKKITGINKFVSIKDDLDEQTFEARKIRVIRPEHIDEFVEKYQEKLLK